MRERMDYFYHPTTPAMGPAPEDLERTLEHLTGRRADPDEVLEIRERCAVDYSDYSPGGDVHRTTRRVIR